MPAPVANFLTNILTTAFVFIGDTILLWLPIILLLTFWELWIFYRRWMFVENLDWVLLEIKLPREITKTPQAMEVFLNALRIGKDGNALEKYWKGWRRAWHSLELVGINGEIHFYLYTQKGFRNIVESQLYAQFPDAEIMEVDDYAKVVDLPEFWADWKMWGAEPTLTGDPVLPIRTYIDYGLDKMQVKEEFKTDPITALIEFMGSLKEGEQAWFQILIKSKDTKDFKTAGEAFMKGVMDKYKSEATAPFKVMSPADKNLLEVVEKNISKLSYDVVMRMMYVTKVDKFDPTRITHFINSFTTPFSTGIYNGFKPANATSVDYPPFKEYRLQKMKEGMAAAYRARGGFYYPVFRTAFPLNTEALATIYHFPGGVSKTPSFARIEAKKGEPPATLPV